MKYIENYKALCFAIVEMAIRDYAVAKKAYEETGDRLVFASLQEIKRFFRSEWFAYLSNLDGRQLINKIKKCC